LSEFRGFWVKKIGSASAKGVGVSLFYEKVKQLCQDIGVSITTFAKKELGIEKGTTTGWKKGGKPQPATLLKIKERFGVDEDYLFDDSVPVQPGRGTHKNQQEEGRMTTQNTDAGSSDTTEIDMPNDVVPIKFTGHEFFENIAWLCKMRCIALGNLPELAGFSRSLLKLWSTGRGISNQKIKKAAEYLGISVDSLTNCEPFRSHRAALDKKLLSFKRAFVWEQCESEILRINGIKDKDSRIDELLRLMGYLKWHEESNGDYYEYGASYAKVLSVLQEETGIGVVWSLSDINGDDRVANLNG